MGSRNKPFYRLVAADSRFATTGRFLENLGWYDPKQKSDHFSVNMERVDYWLGTGAVLSATAKSLVKKARAGQGLPYGSATAPNAPASTVETPSEADAAPAAAEEKPAADEEPKADAPAEKPAAAAPAADEPAAPAGDTDDSSAEASAETEAPEKQEG